MTAWNWMLMAGVTALWCGMFGAVLYLVRS
jgi:hypothetical protein